MRACVDRESMGLLEENSDRGMFATFVKASVEGGQERPRYGKHWRTLFGSPNSPGSLKRVVKKRPGCRMR